MPPIFPLIIGHDPNRGGELRGVKTAADESFASVHDELAGDY